MYVLFSVVIVLGLLQSAISEDPQFWKDKAQRDLRIAKKLHINNKVAKNEILFLGDGNSISTITATRIYKGQQTGGMGEDYELYYERFPNVGLAKTYCADRQVPDSAASGAAYLCGVKSNYQTIGMDDRVQVGKCNEGNPDEYAVDSILQVAAQSGKAIGIVTTTRITHATPSNSYAHSASRYWESDYFIEEDQRGKGCKDIAWQLINQEPGNQMKVMLGGGRREFIPNTMLDPEYGHENLTGKRLDGANLVDQWLAEKAGDSAHYVWNKEQFDAVDPSSADYLLGLFEPSHMNYEAYRPVDEGGEPSLADMTEKAIRILEKNENGYFLLVEGGRMDHSHHEGVGYHALVDGVAFEDAIKRAGDIVSDEDTLTIVTADHSFSFDILGYSSRGNPILGLNDLDHDRQGLPFTTLHYPDGPGAPETLDAIHNTGMRPNLTRTDTEAMEYHQQALVPNQWASHDGEDVMIYAKGPRAHLFHSTHEQTYIMHAMKYAACIGDDANDDCMDETPPITWVICGAAANMAEFVTTLFIAMVAMILY